MYTDLDLLILPLSIRNASVDQWIGGSVDQGGEDSEIDKEDLSNYTRVNAT